jgi:tetratricopeptide (TPR) repeat protein
VPPSRILLPHQLFFTFMFDRLTRRAGNKGAAIVVYSRSILLNPLDADNRFDLGTLLCEAGDIEAGIRLIRRAAELDPSFGEAHIAIGREHARQGRFPDAAASFRRAMRAEPSNPAATIRTASPFIARSFISNQALALRFLPPEIRDGARQALRPNPSSSHQPPRPCAHSGHDATPGR